MATSGTQGSSGGAIAAQALSALSPELQSILKPGKTPDRIQHAITWASKRDPEVLAEHRSRGHKVQDFTDIRNLPVERLDRVANHFARKYRHRALWTGAASGLPGGIWALIAAGADAQLTAVYVVRMAADVAQSYGYDTTLAEEQAHLAEVLAIAAGIDGLRGAGNWLTREGLAHVLPELLPKLLVRLSIELTEEQAAKLVGRIIPGIGAIVGATIDYSFLRVAGERAITYYHHRYLVEHGLAPAEMVPAAAGRAALAPGAARPAYVDGSLVSSLPAGGPASAVPMPAPATVAAMAALAAPTNAQPAQPKKARRSAPERFGIYLAIFAVIALVITLLICFGLGALFFFALAHLLGH